MVKQLDVLPVGNIIPIALHQEMERSYLEYAMSVIVGRALPDVRDGLKPVHRRILYAMYELGLAPDRPYRKCARVVGDVLGKYHPHGDQAVYEALVRLVQDFSSRYPLLSGHGNFGSIDDDPPAAMRYTETRLSPISYQGMLMDISPSIVDFTNNFDNSQQEPVVLPAQLPILLLNGCSGIAVGMATNIPPHHLGELVEGLIALIDNPEISDRQLWKLIPAPDFPTGGEITSLQGVHQTYKTGRGLIPLRGVARIEQVTTGKKRQRERNAIIITELPYQVNKAGWIEKVADMVNQGKLEGIADLRDESDREGMRIVVELKKETNPKQLLDTLYKSTSLQINFGAILLAIVDNKPCQLSLREMLEAFLKFREETLTRNYETELEDSQKKLHLLEGLLIALKQVDRVISILKNSPDSKTAKFHFQQDLKLSEEQGDSILSMPMRRITGLEQDKLQKEHQELTTRINHLEKLLVDRKEFLKALKKELRDLKRKFNDTRRTKILVPIEVREDEGITEITLDKTFPNSPDNPETLPTIKTPRKRRETKATEPNSPLLELSVETIITRPENAILDITYQDHIYWTTLENLTPLSPSKKGEDFVIQRQMIKDSEGLIIITNQGKAYNIFLDQVPPIHNTPKVLVSSLLPKSVQTGNETIIHQFLFPKNHENLDIILLSEQGKIKRIPLSELHNLGNRGVSLIKLKDHDYLQYACLTKEDEEVIIATNSGRLLRFLVTDEFLPIMGKSAQGNTALKLRFQEAIVGCISTKNTGNILLISQFGFIKRLPLSTIRRTKLGELGTMGVQFSRKTDYLLSLHHADSQLTLSVISDSQQVINLPVENIKLWGKDGFGDRILSLDHDEMLIASFTLPQH